MLSVSQNKTTAFLTAACILILAFRQLGPEFRGSQHDLRQQAGTVLHEDLEPRPLSIAEAFPAPEPVPHVEVEPETDPPRPRARIGKVSVLYGEDDEEQSIYNRAVDSHQRHADQHGYPFHVLRYPVVEGYWNKAEYILSLVVNELGKEPVERLEWFMWFDADSIVINPEIPLEIFLPPDDFSEIHYVGSRDSLGLNTGVFFIRVHSRSVKMLTHVCGWPYMDPTILDNWWPDQLIMQMLFNRTEYQPNVLFQPRKWHNAYGKPGWTEAQPGQLLVHFPGMNEERWPHMLQWLALVEGENATLWVIPVNETNYPEQIEEYWSRIRKAISALDKADVWINEHLERHTQALENAYQTLVKVLFEEADNATVLHGAYKRLELVLGMQAGWPDEDGV